VLANLREQLDIPDMVVLVLPALVAVVEHADANEYKKVVQPELHRILTMARPVQVQQYHLALINVCLSRTM